MKLTIDKLLELLPDFKLDRRGKNLTGPCPVCNHNEFGISIEEEHRFGCYRKNKCGFSGNIYTLLKYLGRLDEVVREKSVILPPRIEIFQSEEILVEDDIADISLPIGYKRIEKGCLYIESRGFDKEDLKFFEVGIANLDPRLRKDYVIFPCRVDGRIKGWVARCMKSKAELDRLNFVRKLKGKSPILRYINSLSDFAKILYGVDDISLNTSVLILVEGIFDKIKIDKLLNLYISDEIKCVATFKGAISDEQIKLIKSKGINVKTIVILYDSDIIKNIKKTIELLSTDFDLLIGYHESKDPGDMDLEDLQKVMDNLENPLEFKCNKLEVNKL